MHGLKGQETGTAHGASHEVSEDKYQISSCQQRAMNLPLPLDGTISITGVAGIGNAEWRKHGELTRSYFASRLVKAIGG